MQQWFMGISSLVLDLPSPSLEIRIRPGPETPSPDHSIWLPRGSSSASTAKNGDVGASGSALSISSIFGKGIFVFSLLNMSFAPPYFRSQMSNVASSSLPPLLILQTSLNAEFLSSHILQAILALRWISGHLAINAIPPTHHFVSIHSAILQRCCSANAAWNRKEYKSSILCSASLGSSMVAGSSGICPAT